MDLQYRICTDYFGTHSADQPKLSAYFLPASVEKLTMFNEEGQNTFFTF